MYQKDSDGILDDVIHSIHNDKADPAVENAAAERVWGTLQSEAAAKAAPAIQLTGCADYQAAIPDFLAGRLPEGRRLLVEDHTRNCISCRKALKAARSGGEAARFSRPKAVEHGRWVKWGAVAALVLLTFALSQLGILDQFLPSATPGHISVQSLNGALFQVQGSQNRTLSEGARIAWREGILTAKDTGAKIELPDGSQVEPRERSRFSFSEASDGVTLNLEQGSVIVEAAKQRSGHLYVRTRDCTVAVKGTVFSVNSGTKGSRISVLEGEVVVEQGGRRTSLLPGEQYTTSTKLTRVPLEQEIAWSQDASRHLDLLREIRAMDEDLNKALFPGLRFSSRFLNNVPQNTAIYAALPNLGTGIAEAQEVFMERVQANPALSLWWNETMQKASENGFSPLDAVERLRNFSSFLGDEIVIAVATSADGKLAAPLILAEVTDPAGFRSVLREELRSLNSQSGQEAVILVDERTAVPDLKSEGLYVSLSGDVVAASPNLAALDQFRADLSRGRGGFSRTSFHARLNDLYRDGVDWLFGIDLGQLVASELQESSEQAWAEKAGLTDIRHLIVELRDREGTVESRAQLTFDQERRGIASWLAPPAAIGGLEFLSADANAVAAFAVKNPTMMLDDLLGLLGARDIEEFEQAQAAIGIDIRHDLAEALGGEFVFAIDGPLLPTPSWKMVIETYDATRLQDTIQRLVDLANAELLAEGKKGIELTSSVVGGRTFFHFKSLDVPLLQGHYTFVDGYLLAAPMRPLLTDALQFRETGYTLPRSQEFVALLPHDSQTGFSAVVYQNMKSALQPLLQLGASANIPESQKEYMREFGEQLTATLICAYAEEDRIVFASTGKMGFNPSTLLGMGMGAFPGMEGANPFSRLPGIGNR